ncbi:MAG: hypothetical protein K8S25_06250 [Alphaproteobacteria bacterium]|nr:hypothetical protein [Alphaproteobacteria bacterium]
MNELATASSSGNGAAKSAADRRVRHGLIEDWRDAVGILFLLLVAAFSGALIARYWPGNDEDATHQSGDLNARMASIEDRLSNGKSPPDISALKDRIAKLEARLQNAEVAIAGGTIGANLAATGITPSTGPTLGTALSQLGATTSGPDATRKIVDDITARLTALEGKTATTPADVQGAKEAIGTLTASLAEFNGQIATLGTRLNRIENSDLLSLAHRASLATAVANLTRASQGSSPFKLEYDAVAALLPGDPSLSEIAPVAAGGLPTVGTLIATFGNAGDAAIDAENIAKGDNGWSRLWAHFTSLINSRPVGEVSGDSTENRIARAELRMKSGGDLTAAVKELSAISGAARGPLQAWLAHAKARVKLEATLATLNTRAVAALAGPMSVDDPANPIPQLPTP